MTTKSELLLATQRSITEAAQIIGDHSEATDAMVFGISQVPTSEDNPEEKTRHMQGAIFMAGNPAEVTRGLVRAMQQDSTIKEIVMRAAQSYAIRRLFGKDETPCDCPNCTAEREAVKKAE